MLMRRMRSHDATNYATRKGMIRGSIECVPKSHQHSQASDRKRSQQAGGQQAIASGRKKRRKSQGEKNLYFPRFQHDIDG